MSLSDDEIIGSDDEISESERQAFIKLVRDEEIRRMTRGGTLDDLVAMDCEIAEKDPDLLALYHAGVEQMRQSDEAKVAFNEVIDRLARVIFPGRFVDCIKPQMDEQKDPNIADMHRSIMEKMNKAEMQLIVLVGCQLIALYIRDHPVEASDSIKAAYQLYRLMSSKPNLDCTIL
jgi:hypothetical protein